MIQLVQTGRTQGLVARLTIVLLMLWGSFHYQDAVALDMLTPEMAKATTAEELLSIKMKHMDTAPWHTRHRMLQEQGLEDSPFILAEMFNNEPGFYHGVASGT
jgi:hypothetical protein